ncbi:hypothetical protein PGB90_008682 [Kerria lacca]
MLLHEYKDIIASIASVLTMVQFVSPAILCKDIIYRRSTSGHDIMVFMGGLILSILFLQTALLMEDSYMIFVNTIATTLSFIYLTTYIFYSSEKYDCYKTIVKAGIFISILIIYARNESKDVVNFRFGLICTILFLFFIAAPLFSIKKILRTKNTSSLPMPIIISGTIVSFSWMLYGFAIEDTILQMQNGIAIVLNSIQLGLYSYCKFTKLPKKSAIKSKKFN